jgi:hypothetical protein
VPQHDSGSFWRAGSSAVDRYEAAATAGYEGRDREREYRERDGRDSREAELAREGSGGSAGQQGVYDAAGSSGPRRGGSSLFSNVIGQLRKQATTTKSDGGGDAEGEFCV